MSRTFERHINELYICSTILNRFVELGCTQTVAVAYPYLCLGKYGLRLIYVTTAISLKHV